MSQMEGRCRGANAAMPNRMSTPGGIWLLPFAVIVLVGMLGACGVTSTTTTPSPADGDLLAASSGMCAAIAALPDVAMAQRAFTNLAHAALHRLAADSRLGREQVAAVLEAMLRVEQDFAAQRDAQATTDLPQLKDAADDALRALTLSVPSCRP